MEQENDEIVICKSCGLVHKWSERKQTLEDMGAFDWIVYSCPKCGEEGFTKQILN